MAPRKNYTLDQIEKAVEAVKNGEKIASAAQRFGVPRITLHDKITRRTSIGCSMGPSTILTKVEEEILEKWLLTLAEKHIPLTKDCLLDSVQKLIINQNRKNPFTNNRPGKKWFHSIMKRHPNLSQRVPDNLSRARDNVSEDNIRTWFKEIESYLEEHNLKNILNNPHRLFNADDSAFFLSPKPDRVICKKGDKHPYSKCGDEKDNLTVLITGNAAGDLAPPMIVFSYERIPSSVAASVPDEWAIDISELQAIMTKMSLRVCCDAALPEFGVRWSEVSRAVRNARLPMTSASVARVICRHVAKSLHAEEVEEIVAKLRLRLVASQTRTWHLIRLSGRQSDEPPATTARCLPSRVRQALKEGRTRNLQAEVQTALLGALVFASVSLRGGRQGTPLYAAVAPGTDALLVSSLGAVTLIKAFVKALGYSEYTDANLHGSDIPSLLRISSQSAGAPLSPPPYAPRVTRAPGGLDYTSGAYDERYVDAVIGPDPPLLTHLHITTTNTFFDPSRLNKQMKLVVDLKSSDIARSLRSWVCKGALAPTSDFFSLYRQLSSNKITYAREDSD